MHTTSYPQVSQVLVSYTFELQEMMKSYRTVKLLKMNILIENRHQTKTLYCIFKESASNEMYDRILPLLNPNLSILISCLAMHNLVEFVLTR